MTDPTPEQHAFVLSFVRAVDLVRPSLPRTTEFEFSRQYLADMGFDLKNPPTTIYGYKIIATD